MDGRASVTKDEERVLRGGVQLYTKTLMFKLQSTFTPNAVPLGALASFSPQHDVFTPHFCGIASHRVNILGYNCKTQDHTRRRAAPLRDAARNGAAQRTASDVNRTGSITAVPTYVMQIKRTMSILNSIL